MLTQRQRAMVWAGVALVGIWAVALGARALAQRARMTAERVRAYVDSVELSKLSGANRARAIQELADKINRLTLEDRQRMRMDRSAYRWFEQMTEAEKAQFIEATMPTGFKQMINAFEELPEEKRRRAIDEALKRLRATNDRLQAGPIVMGRGGERPPAVSEELQAQIRTLGLKAFYSESSAQSKAELAPVLEELQRVMESGRMMRRR